MVERKRNEGIKMKKFEMEAPIVVSSRESIVRALRRIADKIEAGIERDFIPGEIQCMEWFVCEDDFKEEVCHSEKIDPFKNPVAAQIGN